MRDTTLPGHRATVSGRHAHGYAHLDDDGRISDTGMRIDVTELNPSLVRAGGEAVSTLADLNTFFAALLAGPAAAARAARRDAHDGARGPDTRCGIRPWTHARAAVVRRRVLDAWRQRPRLPDPFRRHRRRSLGQHRDHHVTSYPRAVRRDDRRRGHRPVRGAVGRIRTPWCRSCSRRPSPQSAAPGGGPGTWSAVRSSPSACPSWSPPPTAHRRPDDNAGAYWLLVETVAQLCLLVQVVRTPPARTATALAAVGVAAVGCLAAADRAGAYPARRARSSPLRGVDLAAASAVGVSAYLRSLDRERDRAVTAARREQRLRLANGSA